VYKGDPAKTAANRLRDFFTVGDIGYLDDAGFLFLCDRKADMIISGGVNIYPAEIEAELLANPKVTDVAVFGVPDADRGEQVKAVVQPADGELPGLVLAAELLASLDGRLARMKWPRTVDFIDEMPRTRPASCRNGGCGIRTGRDATALSDRPRNLLIGRLHGSLPAAMSSDHV
jgi:long-chain acyl-CoA synthetase